MHKCSTCFSKFDSDIDYCPKCGKSVSYIPLKEYIVIRKATTYSNYLKNYPPYHILQLQHIGSKMIKYKKTYDHYEIGDTFPHINSIEPIHIENISNNYSALSNIIQYLLPKRSDISLSIFSKKESNVLLDSQLIKTLQNISNKVFSNIFASFQTNPSIASRFNLKRKNTTKNQFIVKILPIDLINSYSPKNYDLLIVDAKYKQNILINYCVLLTEKNHRYFELFRDKLYNEDIRIVNSGTPIIHLLNQLQKV